MFFHLWDDVCQKSHRNKFKMVFLYILIFNLRVVVFRKEGHMYNITQGMLCQGRPIQYKITFKWSDLIG